MCLRKKILVSIFITLSISGYTQNWHSKLYPENWQPGFADQDGNFLHDFSYAGYRSGLAQLPVIKKNVVDITKPPYSADNKGIKDATDVIQNAIDKVGKSGGGVVFFPAGEYRISVPENRQYGIRINYSNVILRGEGVDKTFLKSVSNYLRDKVVVSFCDENGNWEKMSESPVSLAQDLMKPTNFIPVDDVSAFKIGDKVLINSDVTDEFAAEHGSLNFWKGIRGPGFSRQIISIDTKTRLIEVDSPTRYYLKLRDNARVYKLNPQLSESGIEYLSIGNVDNTKEGMGEGDFNVAGTAAYEVHNSHLIEFRYAENCWIKSVSTYRPVENTTNTHILSNCLLVKNSRFVTVEDCDFRNTLYNGEGGNGYLYCLMSNDCLIKNCYAENARHNYDFKMMESNGNVILNCKSKNPRFPSDFHMMLSMANLFDGFISDGDFIDASFRPYGTPGKVHMHSTTQSVIWNTIGLEMFKNQNLLIDSRQFGKGYVIGTSGKVINVRTTPVAGLRNNISFDSAPEDYVEGVGKGETLVPKSLYLDQLERRKARMKNKRK